MSLPLCKEVCEGPSRRCPRGVDGTRAASQTREGAWPRPRIPAAHGDEAQGSQPPLRPAPSDAEVAITIPALAPQTFCHTPSESASSGARPCDCCPTNAHSGAVGVGDFGAQRSASVSSGWLGSSDLSTPGLEAQGQARPGPAQGLIGVPLLGCGHHLWAGLQWLSAGGKQRPIAFQSGSLVLGGTTGPWPSTSGQHCLPLHLLRRRLMPWRSAHNNVVVFPAIAASL